MSKPSPPCTLALVLGAASALFACLSPGAPVVAQMIVAETPLTNVSDSFYERNGVGFNFSVPGFGNVVGIGPDGQPTRNGAIHFSFGGLDGAIPPFGGYDPNADARFGFAHLGGNGGGFGLNFAFGQGSDRTFTQTNPILVLPNGGTGSVSDTIQRPFVTSFIPVVGDDGPAARPDARARPDASARPDARARRAAGQGRAGRRSTSALRVEQSSATTADLSVSEIKRRKEEKKDAEIDALLAKARQAQADGKLATAKIHFRNAARRASGDSRREILDELEQLMRDE